MLELQHAESAWGFSMDSIYHMTSTHRSRTWLQDVAPFSIEVDPRNASIAQYGSKTRVKAQGNTCNQWLCWSCLDLIGSPESIVYFVGCPHLIQLASSKKGKQLLAQVVDKDVFPSNELPIANPLELTSSEVPMGKGINHVTLKLVSCRKLRYRTKFRLFENGPRDSEV